MAIDERTHLEQLLDVHNKRLHVLEVEAARKGYNTPPEVHSEMADIRAQILAVTQQLTDLLPPGHIPVDLWTYQEVGPPAGDHIRLAWAVRFTPALPTPAIWHDDLLPELHQLLGKLRKHPSRLIALRPKAHLSAALAFGYTFRSTTGFQIWIEQAPNHWWRTSGPAAEASPLHVETLQLDRGDDTVVEVSVARDAGVAIKGYLNRHTIPVRQHIRLIPTVGSGDVAVPDALHALAIARQVRGVIEGVRTARPEPTIHLFLAAPVALAVLIGAHLNACEPVQCYEFERPANAYVPAALLIP
jgi:hypothetical protein